MARGKKERDRGRGRGGYYTHGELKLVLASAMVLICVSREAHNTVVIVHGETTVVLEA